MRVIITLDLDPTLIAEATDLVEDALRDDVVASLKARLDEVYIGPDNYPVVPQDVRVAVGTSEACDYLLDAARVGLDGDSPNALAADEAFTLLTALDGSDG